MVGMSFMKCRHVLDHLPPMKRIMNLTLTQTHMKENSSKKHVFPKNVSRTALLHPRTLEERIARLLEEERAWNDLAHWAMYEHLVVSFFCILAKSCT